MDSRFLLAGCASLISLFLSSSAGAGECCQPPPKPRHHCWHCNPPPIADIVETIAVRREAAPLRRRFDVDLQAESGREEDECSKGDSSAESGTEDEKPEHTCENSEEVEALRSDVMELARLIKELRDTVQDQNRSISGLRQLQKHQEAN